LAPVELSAAHPVIKVTTHETGSTTLVLTLLNASGHAITHWTRLAKAGSTTVSLAIPASLQHAGHDSLRITPSRGGKSVTRPVALRA
jgi:hypothetical protein